MKIIISILFLLCAFDASAQESNLIRVLGDSLIGRQINGESVREVKGNVIMTQDKVVITCDKAIQYIAKNEAELIGNVVVKQDSIIIKTVLGYYYGNSKVAFSESGVDYFDGHIRLNSEKGYYYFDDKRAYFFDNVKLFDSVSNLTSNRLTYFDDSDRAVAVGNVIVKDTASIIHADSLVHFRGEGKTFGFNNVAVFDPKNKIAVAGGYLENDRKSNYSKILNEPLLVRIDTTNSGEQDTLIISANVLEAYSDSSKKMIATDSVKIVRGDFASVNNYSVYFQDKQNLFTLKRENDLKQPVLWNENAQLTGDTVNIFTDENKLKEMYINSNAAIISDNPSYPLRFDQMSGTNIKMIFGENGLEQTELIGNVLSIYYLYEDGEPNGLLKSSSENAKIYFKNNDVDDVRLYGNPISEFHPENLIEGKEIDFTLPTFIIHGGRPKKNDLIKSREQILKHLSEYVKENGK